VPAAPPAAVLQRINASSTRVTRRVEIYEADGITRWANDTGNFLVGGSVSVDYGRDERRTVDLQLDNTTGALNADPNGGFWYDKILKVFRGVEYLDATTMRVNLCKNPSFETDLAGWTANSGTITRTVGTPGAGGVVDGTARMDYTVTTSSTSCYSQYYTDHGEVAAGETLSISAYVFTASASRGAFIAIQWQNASGSTIGSTISGTFAVLNANEQARIGITATAPANASRLRVLIYYRSSANGSPASGTLRTDAVLIEKQSTIRDFFVGAKSDFSGGGTEKYWEVQIGEFMIDRMSEPFFPNIVSITGRDYAKKCLTSKFTQATGFSSGTTIETVIMAIGQNAGITKFLFPVTGKTLGRDFVFEAGVERWKAMSEIARSYGFELFFDTQGFCVLQAMQDPASSPVVATFRTGSQGNMASYDKSMNDSRIYNHMFVSGEATDTIPVYASAKNEQPNSPTRIARIGERVYRYTSSFITTTAQAQDVANKFLKIHALEEYDVNIDSIVYPWLEAGDIVEFIDPDAGPNQPKNFLLSSITIPLGLGPMSCNAKRVAIVSG
jgi:hypothetical protein